MGPKIELNYVVSVRDDAASGKVQVTLDRSGTLWLTDRELADELATSLKDGELVAVEYVDQAKQIREVFPPVVDRIVALSEAGPEEPVEVQAMKRPSLLELRRDHPRFDELYEFLKECHRDKAETALAVFPGSRPIQDARLLSDKPK